MSILQRNPGIDRLKGVAVLLMIACHGTMFLIQPYRPSSAWLVFVGNTMVICAPAFMFAFGYCIAYPRPWKRIAYRTLVIALGIVAMDIIMLNLSAPPFQYHILYLFLAASLSIPLTTRFAPHTVAMFAFATWVLGIVGDYLLTYHPPTSYNPLFDFLFGYGAHVDDIGGVRTMNIPAGHCLGFALMGAAFRRLEDQGMPFGRIMSWCVAGALFLVVVEISIFQKNPDTWPTCMIVLYGLSVPLLMKLLSAWNEPWLDMLLLPLGRHVMGIYIVHHALLFGMTMAMGFKISYARFEAEPIPIYFSDTQLMSITCILIVASYLTARTLDVVIARRRATAFQAKHGIHNV